MKKGESISMSVIIIAAIALLVLVVLAVLILRSANSVADGSGCRGAGGQCADECDEDQTNVWTQNGKLGGCLEGQKCCKQGTLGSAPEE